MTTVVISRVGIVVIQKPIVTTESSDKSDVIKSVRSS
jgi:hypothetical protein